MVKEENYDLFYSPEKVYGISYMMNMQNNICVRKGESKQMSCLEGCNPYLVYSTTNDENQGKYGKILNSARIQRRPFFRYIYSENENLFYQEELPWLEWKDVYGPNQLVNLSIKTQLRIAIRWAASRGIYNLDGVRIMVVSDEVLLNLHDRTVRTFGYIPIFTDFSNARDVGDLPSELARFNLTPEEENIVRSAILLPPITKENSPCSRINLMYPPIESNAISDVCYTFVGQTYFSRAYSLYLLFTNEKNYEIKLAYLLILQDYAKIALEMNQKYNVLYPERETRKAYETGDTPTRKIGDKIYYQNQQEFLQELLKIEIPRYQVILPSLTARNV